MLIAFCNALVVHALSLRYLAPLVIDFHASCIGMIHLTHSSHRNFSEIV